MFRGTRDMCIAFDTGNSPSMGPRHKAEGVNLVDSPPEAASVMAIEAHRNA